MGLSSDLRKFIDPGYDDFEGFPTDGASVASKWGGAFAAAFKDALTPSTAGGLISEGSEVLLTQTLTAAFPPDADPLPQLPAALDAALTAAAADVVSKSNTPLPATAAVAPSSPYNSATEVFKGLTLEGPNEENPEGESVGKQIADLAEARFDSWIQTGKYVGLAASASPVPDTKWGSPPVED